LTKENDGGIIDVGGGDMDITGASGAIARSDYGRMKAHAERYYEEIRNRTTDVEAIANNTDFSVEDVDAVKRHIFIDEHDLGDEFPERFEPNYDMAVSWQRLIDGKNIQKMDLILLQHELHELRQMAQGVSFYVAHESAQSVYNYSEFVKQLNEREGVF
jgi:hypothetical protein